MNLQFTGCLRIIVRLVLTYVLLCKQNIKIKIILFDIFINEHQFELNND